MGIALIKVLHNNSNNINNLRKAYNPIQAPSAKTPYAQSRSSFVFLCENYLQNNKTSHKCSALTKWMFSDALSFRNHGFNHRKIKTHCSQWPLACLSIHRIILFRTSLFCGECVLSCCLERSLHVKIAKLCHYFGDRLQRFQLSVYHFKRNASLAAASTKALLCKRLNLSSESTVHKLYPGTTGSRPGVGAFLCK